MNATDIKSTLRRRLNPGLYSQLSKIRRSFGGPDAVPSVQPPQASLAEIGEPFAGALHSMYRGEPQPGSDGLSHSPDPITQVSIAEGLCLYRLCRDRKASATMEVGCAYGFSTLYLLAALAANPAALHVAIDPCEHAMWHGIGARKVTDVQMDRAFRLVQESSVIAIPRFIAEGSQFDLIFIDGNHRFDDVLVDFTLSALACKQGGLIILDDMWMPSIRKAASFVRRNRGDFSELPASVDNISVFQKTAEDRRDWKHFEDFG
jgi:predicted O-methyltransferase YrrM